MTSAARNTEGDKLYFSTKPNSYLSHLRACQLSDELGDSRRFEFSLRKTLHKSSWLLDKIELEKAKHSSYLGVAFPSNVSCRHQQDSILCKAKVLSRAIVKFYHTKGGCYVQEALLTFNAKIISVISYGIAVW
ncbi:hypothetical protein JRQ81_012940, partial [Phrynocephalus forsythii]